MSTLVDFAICAPAQKGAQSGQVSASGLEAACAQQLRDLMCLVKAVPAVWLLGLSKTVLTLRLVSLQGISACRSVVTPC